MEEWERLLWESRQNVKSHRVEKAVVLTLFFIALFIVLLAMSRSGHSGLCWVTACN